MTTTEEKLKLWEARVGAYHYEIFENCSETYRDDGLAQGIFELIDLVRRMQRVIELKNEALFHLGSKVSWVEGECFKNDIRFQGFSVTEIADDALAITVENVGDETLLTANPEE